MKSSASELGLSDHLCSASVDKPNCEVYMTSGSCCARKKNTQSFVIYNLMAAPLLELFILITDVLHFIITVEPYL